MEKCDTKFKLENARITRINNREKVAFVTVLVKTGRFPDYFDLTVFDQGLGNFRDGDAVNVVGELRKRKPRDGSSIWETQLVAKQFSLGDTKLAPYPKRSGEPRNDTHAAPPDDDLDF